MYVLVSVTEVQAHGLEPWMDEIIQAEALEADVYYWKLEATIHCESSHYDMNVITGHRLGLALEIGAVQLHPQGLLPAFYAQGYDNPRNFQQSVRFLARMVARGLKVARAWTCYPK